MHLHPSFRCPLTRYSLYRQLLLLHRHPAGLFQRCGSFGQLLPRDALRHQHDRLRNRFSCSSVNPLASTRPAPAFSPAATHSPHSSPRPQLQARSLLMSSVFGARCCFAGRNAHMHVFTTNGLTRVAFTVLAIFAFSGNIPRSDPQGAEAFGCIFY